MTAPADPPAALLRPAATRRRRLRKWLLIGLGVPTLVALAVGGYYYVTFSRLIDERLHGERMRALPRVFARPLEFRKGQWLGEEQVIKLLNDVGYAQRPAVERPGEFALAEHRLTVMPRGGPQADRIVSITFNPKGGVQPASGGPAVASGAIEKIEAGGQPLGAATFDAPMLTSLFTSSREKRRRVSLSLIPKHVRQAVLGIEDRRFFDHPGIDPIRIFGAIVTNVRGDKPYLVGASTITQQLVKNFFLKPEKSYRRKLQEQFLALVLETRATKDEILELYLNDVYLGQRGSFAIHGVAEGARMFFGKDVTNLSLAEAATMAGTIQSPFYHSPFTSPTRARDRRNLVLQVMVDAGYVNRAEAERAGREPLEVARQALDSAAPYFVDLVGRTLSEQVPGLLTSAKSVDIFTTLDASLQRTAQDVVAASIGSIDQQLAKRKVENTAQVALIAISPGTGEILAFVGGRSYNQSQFNRVLSGRRQPGSVFKPFVYLAAFEKAAAEGRTDITPATLVNDEPTTFDYDGQQWTPSNYEEEYDGMIPLRRALAKSRNVATVHVAELAGFGTIAALWKKMGSATAPRPYPSITLGVFEATPMEVASAYTVFPNLGRLVPVRAVRHVTSDGQELPLTHAEPRMVARPDTTFLVLNMMRSVVSEGTAAAVRAMGFVPDAAGKTGTTNDLRDAWFVGFTPDLLTAVWVGFDDNQPLGISGSAAAVPIWTRFMKVALSGLPNKPFTQPGGITWADIDRDTGLLAQPGCPRPIREAFLAGTEPVTACALHRFE